MQMHISHFWDSCLISSPLTHLKFGQSYQFFGVRQVPHIRHISFLRCDKLLNFQLNLSNPSEFQNCFRPTFHFPPNDDEAGDTRPTAWRLLYTHRAIIFCSATREIFGPLIPCPKGGTSADHKVLFVNTSCHYFQNGLIIGGHIRWHFLHEWADETLSHY